MRACVCVCVRALACVHVCVCVCAGGGGGGGGGDGTEGYTDTLQHVFFMSRDSFIVRKVVSVTAADEIGHFSGLSTFNRNPVCS